MTGPAFPYPDANGRVTVWLLMKGQDCEGGAPLGLFATRDLAKAALYETAEQLSFTLDDARREDDGSLHLHAGCDWVSLTPHDVRMQDAIEGSAS